MTTASVETGGASYEGEHFSKTPGTALVTLRVMDGMTRTFCLVVHDLDVAITRLRDAGLAFGGNVVAGPGGRQILRANPAGNLIELFQPAHRPTSPAEAS